MFMNVKEVEVILFGIHSDKDLRLEYPELAEEPVFKSMKVKEVRLCWLLGNRTSPIYKLSKKERLLKAVQLVYGQHYDKNKDVAEWLSGNIPDNIKEGVAMMESYNPEYRLRAKLLSQYMFDVLNEMVVLDNQTIAAMDIDEKKKYTDLVVKVHEQLPDMVKRLETSYGVRTIEKNTRKQVLVSINDVIK
jgi:hypothetical protein